MNKDSIVLLVLMLACAIGCGRSANMNAGISKEIYQIKWDNICKKRIFFGHQSVGFNIIDGVQDATSEARKVSLTVAETMNPESFSKPVFAHAKVGENKKPISKCDEFRRVMENGVGEKIDTAFFKFCYVDINGDTDINTLFRYYVDTMSFLESKYPSVRFVHVTVPMTTALNGIKARIKRLAGMPVWGDEDNVKRHAFNELMREKYENGGLLFDLAHLESNNGSSVFRFKGVEYPALCEDYTDDGGHLNTAGRAAVAARLLVLLAE